MIEQTTSPDTSDTDPQQDLSAVFVEARSLLVSFEILGAGIGHQLLYIALLGMALLFLAIPLLLPGIAPFSDWAVVRHGSPAIALIVVFGVTSISTQLFRLLACRQSARIAMQMLVSELHIAEESVDDRSTSKRRSRASGERATSDDRLTVNRRRISTSGENS